MEKLDGVGNLETLRVPSAGFGRNWKSLISEFVATASREPSVLSTADVIFASPFIKIFESNFRSCVTGLFSLSESSVGA